MGSTFNWGTTDAQSPWSNIDGPRLACSVGALQLVESNQAAPLKLHVLASIAVGLPQRTMSAPLGSSQLHDLLGQSILQDPDGTGEFEITDLFCNEVELQGLPFRFIAGSGTSAHTKMEYLAQSILTIAGKDLPPEFLEPAGDLIFAVAYLSEAVCARAKIRRTRQPLPTQEDELVIPTTAVLRALESAIRFPLELLGDDRLAALQPLTSRPGDQFDVYPGETSNVVAVKPLLQTDSDLIVVCPGELAAALTVQLQTLAARSGCIPELTTAHRRYVTAYVHHIVTGGPIDFADPVSHAESGIDLISGDLQGQGIHIVVEVDPLNDYDADEPFSIWFAPNRDNQIASLISTASETPAVVIRCTLSSSRGQAIAGSGIDSIRLLHLEAPDLVTLFKLKWNDHPWDLVRFARAVEKLNENTRIFGESFLGEYGIYDDNHDSFYLSDEAPPTALMIGGQYSLKYRAAERAKFDEHIVPVHGGSIRSVSLSGLEFGPIYLLFERVPALSVELDNLFIWVRARTRDLDAPMTEILEGATYWIWQITEELRDRIAHRELRLLLTVEMSDSGNPIELIRINELEFHIIIRPRVSFVAPSFGNEYDRILVTALLKDLFQPLVQGEIDVASILEQVAPPGDKRMFLTSSNPIVELHDSRIAALSRTVPDSLAAEVLDELGNQLFASNRYPLGDIPIERTTEILNEAVAVHYRRLTDLIRRYDAVLLIERLIGHSAGLEVTTRMEQMRRLTRVACYGAEHYPPSKLRKEDNKRVEASLGVRFLVELLSATGSAGHQVPNDDSYDLLVALAVEIVLKGMQSDASHYRLSDVRASRLPSGRLGTTQDDRWASGLVEHSELLIARQLQGEPDRDQESQAWNFTKQDDRAFTAEFGFTVNEMQVGLITLYENIPRNDEAPAVVSFPRKGAIAAIVARTGWTDDRAASLLDLYTLAPVVDFRLDAETGPWRYGRTRSYLRQPIVSLNGSPEALLRWSPARLLQAVGDLVSLYRTGRLKGESQEMKAALGSVRQASNLTFEHRVAARYREIGYPSVFERVTNWAGVPLRDSTGANLGDIDTLIIDESRKTIIVIEAKDFETARTPIEMSREMNKLRNQAVKKSHRRAEWVREHLGLFTNASAGWAVEEVVVTSRRSTATATGNGHETVVAFDDLGPRT